MRFWRSDRDWRSTLREFIYLDEVSVTSLLAARDGEIPASVTDKLTRSAESESKLSASLPTKGVQLGSESRTKVADTSSKEVVRRAVIQSTFRRLHRGGDRKTRAFGSDRSLKLDGTIETTVEFRRRFKKLAKEGVARRFDLMTRGDLVEIEVTLRPAKTFVAGHALESMAKIMVGRPQLFGDAAYQIQQTIPIADVLNDLMVGLVPIHGVATNISLLEVDGHAYIIDRRVLAADSEIELKAMPIQIVAQTDAGSYWKDLRRVLYSGNRYTVYARLASAELKYDWTALKLNELLRDMSAEMGAAVAALETIVETQFDSLSAQEEPVLDGRAVMRKFAELLPGDVSKAHQGTLSDAISLAAGELQSAEDTAGTRAAFDIVIDAHERATGFEVDRLKMTKIRAEVMKAADAEHVAAKLAGASQTKAPPGLLEVEVIAIYW